jgi:hypothetical protein
MGGRGIRRIFLCRMSWGTISTSDLLFEVSLILDGLRSSI